MTSYVVRVGFDDRVRLQLGGPLVDVKKGDKVFWRRGWRDLPKGPIGRSRGLKWVILSSFEDHGPPPPEPERKPVLHPRPQHAQLRRDGIEPQYSRASMGYDQWE